MTDTTEWKVYRYEAREDGDDTSFTAAFKESGGVVWWCLHFEKWEGPGGILPGMIRVLPERHEVHVTENFPETALMVLLQWWRAGYTCPVYIPVRSTPAYRGEYVTC